MLLCESCKFGEKKYVNWDNGLFLLVYPGGASGALAVWVGTEGLLHLCSYNQFVIDAFRMLYNNDYDDDPKFCSNYHFGN